MFPIAIIGAFFGLASLENIKDTNVILTGVSIISLIGYLVVIIIGIDRATKYYDSGQGGVAFMINLVLAMSVLLGVAYLIFGYKLF
jgi:hypothetical protein